MPADLLQIADAVVALLNVTGLSLAFTAERLYLPQFELPDMQVLHVTVVPRTKTTKPLTRSRNIDVITVDIAVQKKLNAGDNADIDALVNLVDEIETRFDRERLSDVPDAICTAKKPDPVYAPEHIEKLRQFTSILTLTFTFIG